MFLLFASQLPLLLWFSNRKGRGLVTVCSRTSQILLQKEWTERWSINHLLGRMFLYVLSGVEKKNLPYPSFLELYNGRWMTKVTFKGRGQSLVLNRALVFHSPFPTLIYFRPNWYSISKVFQKTTLILRGLFTGDNFKGSIFYMLFIGVLFVK